MSQYNVRVKSIDKVTHDVLSIATDKPQSFNFIPGQAADISINKTGWQNEKRSFTFTCLPDKDYLEFTIKTYPLRKGVTNELLNLRKNDELILHDVFGAISYKGKGVFIAGGAGVTPFICIFRYLQSKNEVGDNKLIFANKTKDDIILAKEFENILGSNFINILSDEKVKGYAFGQINEYFLKANSGGIDQFFYVCGPPPMMDAIEKQLLHLKVDENHLVKEEI